MGDPQSPRKHGGLAVLGSGAKVKPSGVGGMQADVSLGPLAPQPPGCWELRNPVLGPV